MVDAGTKRRYASGARTDGNRRKKARADGGAHVKGPGIFVTCVRGKERKAAHELIDVLEEIAERLYASVDVCEYAASPYARQGEDEREDGRRNGMAVRRPGTARTEGTKPEAPHIEEQIAAEVRAVRRRPLSHEEPRKQRRFVPVYTDIACLVFLAVAPPVDPVAVTQALLEEVRQTGQARSRFVQRLSPVCGTVRAEMEAVGAYAEQLVRERREATTPPPRTYKVDVRVRLHSALGKMDIIQHIAARIARLAAEQDGPRGWRTDLTNPEVVVNVEVYKMVVGIGLVTRFEAYRRLNPLMLAQHVQAERAGDKEATGGLGAAGKDAE